MTGTSIFVVVSSQTFKLQLSSRQCFYFSYNEIILVLQDLSAERGMHFYQSFLMNSFIASVLSYCYVLDTEQCRFCRQFKTVATRPCQNQMRLLVLYYYCCIVCAPCCHYLSSMLWMIASTISILTLKMYNMKGFCLTNLNLIQISSEILIKT